MIEKIQVGYTHVFLNNISVYHKYILYTDNTGKEFYARGGPVSSFSSTTGWVIETVSGEYTKDTMDWDPSRDPINPDLNATPPPPRNHYYWR